MASSQGNHGIVTSCPDVHSPFKWLSTMAENMVASLSVISRSTRPNMFASGEAHDLGVPFYTNLRPNVSLSIVADIVGKIAGC